MEREREREREREKREREERQGRLSLPHVYSPEGSWLLLYWLGVSPQNSCCN